MILWKWNTNFSFRNYLFSLLIWTHNNVVLLSIEHMTICGMLVNVTCYSAIFYFTLNKVDSASDASSCKYIVIYIIKLKQFFLNFFHITNLLCIQISFTNQWPRVRSCDFCNWMGLCRCLGRNMNWLQYSKFCFL